jgi:hypothetical protein
MGDHVRGVRPAGFAQMGLAAAPARSPLQPVTGVEAAGRGQTVSARREVLRLPPAHPLTVTVVLPGPGPAQDLNRGDLPQPARSTGREDGLQEGGAVPAGLLGPLLPDVLAPGEPAGVDPGAAALGPVGRDAPRQPPPDLGPQPLPLWGQGDRTASGRRDSPPDACPSSPCARSGAGSRRCDPRNRLTGRCGALAGDLRRPPSASALPGSTMGRMPAGGHAVIKARTVGARSGEAARPGPFDLPVTGTDARGLVGRAARPDGGACGHHGNFCTSPEKL